MGAISKRIGNATLFDSRAIFPKRKTDAREGADLFLKEGIDREDFEMTAKRLRASLFLGVLLHPFLARSNQISR